MSELDEIFEAMEGVEFASRVNVASGLKTFQRAVYRDHATRSLVERSRDEAASWLILFRVLRLCRQTIDPRYEHPNDVAIGSYILVLAGGNSSALPRIAAEAARTAPNLWWARKIADSVLSGYDSDTRTDVQVALGSLQFFEILAEKHCNWFSTVPWPHGLVRPTVIKSQLIWSADSVSGGERAIKASADAWRLEAA